MLASLLPGTLCRLRPEIPYDILDRVATQVERDDVVMFLRHITRNYGEFLTRHGKFVLFVPHYEELT